MIEICDRDVWRTVSLRSILLPAGAELSGNDHRAAIALRSGPYEVLRAFFCRCSEIV